MQPPHDSHLYAERLFDGPLPWAKLRQGHKLIRLGERYSPERLDAACRRALSVDLIDVRRLKRILVEALEQEATQPEPPPMPPGRFARPGAVVNVAAEWTMLATAFNLRTLCRVWRPSPFIGLFNGPEPRPAS